MRRVIQWTLLPAAVVAVACSSHDAKSRTAMNDDLKRDLKLASQTQDLKINPDEVSPESHQEMALKLKRAPDGPKVIRSEHPTVKASTRAEQVAEIKADVPQVEVMASAPAPSESPSPDAPPLARPSAAPTQGYPGADRIPASNGGSGSVLGGIFGAVLRGGIVGGDDHCDPRTPPRAGRPVGGDAGMGGIFHGGGGVMGRPRY